MKSSILSKIAVLALAASAFAQAQNVNARKENQQDRIAQGVKSGQLTAGETARLEKHQASINREEHRMRAADNGKLTAQDRAALAQRQNNQSKAIYRDKHNAAQQAR